MNGPSGELANAPQLGNRAAFLRGMLSDLAIMTAIGLFLGVLGPFGTSDLPFTVRLLSWLAFAYIGYACYRPMAPLVEWAERALHLPSIGLWIAAAAISSVPMTFLVLGIGNLRNPFHWPGLDIALTSYFYVFMVGGAVTLLFNILGLRGSGEANGPVHSEASAEAATNPPPQEPTASSQQVQSSPLLDALSPVLGSDVIALQMEDHYVRVHTALGSEMVLMRLRDAIVHISDIEGRQVHRSWWVARLAIEDVRREGRNVRLVLPGGLEAPVSRAQVSELKDAGWI
ncbi:LytTR family DNA-binding domain-containing protein [uncultured Erythrobacter sp.]|uniref:LytTR family DNA-binding domain-containing protein n=1 Tax=uncultured Erythrobacter sp. TaxID=263913 RepID=UPI0026292417|nr:LytTR family DNA-binding domain-containing protein [uncultured Erythrobacter sp.]